MLKVNEQVENILKYVPATRSSDKELFITYMRKFGMNLTEAQETMFRKMPSLETIRRSRQLIQQEGRFPASEAVNEKRFSLFKEMRYNIGSKLPEEILEMPREIKVCIVDGCDTTNEKFRFTRNMCTKHNLRYKVHGDVNRVDTVATHGQRNHPLYQTWQGMMTRCYNENQDSYKYYGGKGVTVCDRWHDINNFIEDMGERPNGKTLDRIDGNGNYQPSNCRWADIYEQASNKHYKPNASGELSVYKEGSKYKTLVVLRNERHYLGLFDTIEEAATARDEFHKQMRENPHSITEQPGSAAFPTPKKIYQPVPWDDEN